jgi:hypothetical protein
MSKVNCNNNVKKYESKNGQTTFIKDNETGKKMVQSKSGKSYIANNKKFEK